MKQAAAGHPPGGSLRNSDDDLTYYGHRAVEEREQAALASSNVARSAHLALALIYDDQVQYLSRKAA